MSWAIRDISSDTPSVTLHANQAHGNRVWHTSKTASSSCEGHVSMVRSVFFSKSVLLSIVPVKSSDRFE